MSAAVMTPVDYEILCEQGRLAAEEMDKGRFVIGDLACDVETRYGGHQIDDFAREINVGKSSVKAYRTVCRFYTPSTRIAFLENNPRITYTHMRHAMRLQSVDAAYSFLEECSANGYTTDEAAHHIGERVGGGDSDRESVVLPIDYDDATGVITLSFVSKKPRLDKGLYKVTVEKA